MITLHIPLIGYAEREPPKFNRQEWGLWIAYNAGHVPVIVRTEDDRDYDTLLAAGAQSVVPDVFEGSLALAAQTLLKVGVIADRVDILIRDERRGYYDLRPQKSAEA